jgi:flagellar biosynthesis anti-sigma factor FlgM
MTVDKLSRFSISSIPLTRDNPAANTSAGTRSEQASSSAQQNSEAVRIGAGFESSAGSASAEASNAAKVARLREQVASGSYKPDTTKVAEALARDLFA